MEFIKTDLEITETHTKATYKAKACDFRELFNALSDFHDGSGAEECCVYLRLFSPEEIRDDGKSAVEKAIESGEEIPEARGRKTRKRKKELVAVPVDAEKGSREVTSFHWRTVKPDNAKFIGYLFYVDGWPAKVECRKVAALGGNESEIKVELPSNVADKVLPVLERALTA